MTDLERLLTALREDTDTSARPFPSPVPQAGQSISQWGSETAALRTLHDRSAIAHRKRVTALSKELFGVTAEDLLPAHEVELSHRTVVIDVPRHEARAAAVPELAANLPSAPRPLSGTPQPTSVTVRVTSPPEPTAAVVYLHGGAFWMGGGEVSCIVDRSLLDHVSALSNAVVCDVDYRLAPECPFPASDIDALVVLDAIRSGMFGVQGVPIALLGTSSGANNAARAAKIEGIRGNRVAALGLVVPSVALAAGQQSADADPEAWEIRRSLLRGYLGDVDPNDPWFSPGTLTHLGGMPPTFAVVAQFDEVAAGGEGLCAAIRAAGQSAEARVYPMTHVVATPHVHASFIRDTAEFLRARLSGAGDSTTT